MTMPLLPDATYAASLAPTVNLHDVELCTTGNHPGSTGRTPVSRAHFESMLAAAQDPEVDRAPSHPGHVDPRFVQTVFDGEPALGYVRPTRIVDYADGTSKLIGDLVDVPSKMAAILPKAFARRSIEFEPKITPSGRAYPAALTGLGLLGVAIPAVKGLADIAARYSAQPIASVQPAIWIDDTPTGMQSLAASWFTAGDDVARTAGYPTEGVTMPHLDPTRYAALVQAENVRHAQGLAAALSASAVADTVTPALPGYPGLPTPALPDPNAVAQLPGWPAPVGQMPAPVAAPLAPVAPPAQPVAPQLPAGYALDASGQMVPAAPPAPQFTPPAPPVAPAGAGWVMGPGGVPQLATPAPAQFAQPLPPATQPVAPQFAAPPVMAAYPAPAQFAQAPTVTFAGQPYAAQPTAPAPLAPQFAAPAVGMLSAGQLSELQSRAERGDAAMAALEAQQRAHFLDAAVTQGRIALTERPHWEISLQRDPAATLNLLNQLTPGRVPVAPAGQALSYAPQGGQVADAAWDAWEHDTFGTGQPAAQQPVNPAAFYAPMGV